MNSRARAPVRLTGAITFLLAAVACGPTASEHSSVVAERDSLREAIQALHSEIERLSRTEQYYLQAASAQRSAQRHDSAAALLTLLIEQFPSSPQVPEVRRQRSRDLVQHTRGMLGEARRRHESSNLVGAAILVDQIIELNTTPTLTSAARQLKSRIERDQRRAVAEAARLAAAQREQELRGNAELELVRWSWTSTAGGRYFKASGLVKNISGSSMDNVVAVMMLYDASGNFITSDDALIDYRPLLPGQSSPFSVMASRNPAMQRASIQFKEFTGRQITTYNSSR